MHRHSTYNCRPLAQALVALRDLKKVFPEQLSVKSSATIALGLIEETLNSSSIGGFQVDFGRHFTEIVNAALKAKASTAIYEGVCEQIFSYALKMVETPELEERWSTRSICEQKIIGLTSLHVFQIAS